MKKFFLMAALFAAGMLCTTEAGGQTPSEQYIAPEVKKGRKPTNYKVQNDKKAMSQINGHAKATGGSMDAALRKANAEAAAKHQREQVAAAKKKAGQNK